MATGQAVIGALRVTLGINTAAFEKGLDLARREMVRTGKDLDRIGQKMASIGQSLSLKITLPVLAASAGVLKMAGDFESAMNRVEAATGAAGDQLQALRDQAKAFGADKRFTATAQEAATVMEMLAKNGLSVTQILDGATEATLKLAAATGSDFAPAADLATDVVQQFGMQASDLQGVVDKVTGALIASKFDFQDYALAVGQAGGVAGGLGVSFEEFNTAIAATSSLFASGSDAGTSFKNFMVRLVPTSDEAASVMAKLGLRFFEADGRMKSLANIAQQLREKLGGLADEAQTEALTKMFGTDAMRTAIGLMNLGADGINRLSGEIAKASAQTQMEARMKGLNGGLTQLRKSVESLAIALGDSGFLAAAARFIEALADMVRWTAQLPSSLLKLVGVMAAVAAAVGPVIFVFGKLIGTWGTMLAFIARLSPAWATAGAAMTAAGGKSALLAASFGRLRLAMTFLLGPWGIAIGAIAVALGYLITKSYAAAEASEEHKTRAEQLSKAKEALIGVTNRLISATGSERKEALLAAAAAQRKAIEDVRAAKAALARAMAERELARSIANKTFELTKHPGAEGFAIGVANEIQTAKADANAKAAIDNLKSAMDNLQGLMQAISAPAPVAGVGGTSNPSFDSGSSRSARDDSEQRAKERLRLQHEMEQEALDGQRTLLEAQRDITYSYEERGKLAREILDIEHRQRELDIAFDLAMVETDKTISEQQKEEARARAVKQKIVNDQVTALRKQAIADEVELERQRQFNETEATRYDIKRGLLEAERNLATTASERRRIELEILELAYRERRERLQRIIQESKDADERRRAEMELASLPAQQQRDTEGVKKSTMGPLETYLDSLPSNAAEMNEALEGVAANGLQKLEDGLTAVLMGTKSLKAAFHEMAASILADLIRIAIQQMIVKALMSAFGGGFSGGGEIFGSNPTGGALGMAGGGKIRGPGGPTADKVPIWASNGEYMINAKAVRSVGVGFLDAINKGQMKRLAIGGAISPLASVPRIGARPAIRRAANDGMDRVQLTFNNDFRGADPSSVAAIQQRLDQMEAEFPARVVTAYQDARARFIVRGNR